MHSFNNKDPSWVFVCFECFKQVFAFIWYKSTVHPQKTTFCKDVLKKTKYGVEIYNLFYILCIRRRAYGCYYCKPSFY